MVAGTFRARRGRADVCDLLQAAATPRGAFRRPPEGRAHKRPSIRMRGIPPRAPRLRAPLSALDVCRIRPRADAAHLDACGRADHSFLGGSTTSVSVMLAERGGECFSGTNERRPRRLVPVRRSTGQASRRLLLPARWTLDRAPLRSRRPTAGQARLRGVLQPVARAHPLRPVRVPLEFAGADHIRFRHQRRHGGSRQPRQPRWQPLSAPVCDRVYRSPATSRRALSAACASWYSRLLIGASGIRRRRPRRHATR